MNLWFIVPMELQFQRNIAALGPTGWFHKWAWKLLYKYNVH